MRRELQPPPEPLEEVEFIDTGYRRSPVDHRDWLYRPVAMAAAAEQRPAPRAYRADKRSPLVPYNQGDSPSCVGWSTATLKKIQERLDKRRSIDFNGEAFYEPIAQPGGGAYIRDALERARTVGVPAATDGRLYRIDAYAGIAPKDHEAVKHAIVKHRGLLIGFEVTRAWAVGGGAEFEDTGAEVLGGHAMFIAGYDALGPDGLNTWGPLWSEDGRAKLPWAYWDAHVWECWALVDHDD